MRRTVKIKHAGFIGILLTIILIFDTALRISAKDTDASEVRSRFCGVNVTSRMDQTGSLNLSSLQFWSPWVYSFERAGATGPNHKLEFNVCGGASPETVPSVDPCRGSTVCETVGMDRKPFSLLEKNRDDEINFVHVPMLSYNGPTCPLNNSPKHIRVLLLCYQHLGYPRLVFNTGCHTTFEWATSAACTTPPRRNEVPCYTYDSAGQLYDLTSLIKVSGSHQVETNYPEDSFTINVCSEMVPDDNSAIPPGSSAVYKRGDKIFVAGRLKSRLSFLNDNLQLVYEASSSDKKVPGCISPAKTVIIFRCPKMGMAKPPVLISSTDCYYEIDWETEHACPLSTLKGNSTTCSFNKKSHGVNIDLSPLRRGKTEDPYSVLGEINGTTFEFLLNVCGGISEIRKCGSGWKSNSVCLRLNESDTGMVLTKTTNSKLKYADGEVSLTYEGHMKSCPRNKELSSVVIINFICNETASNDGIGTAAFLYEEECKFVFEWPTKYACVKNANPSCSFSHSSSQFNLGAISAATGQSVWNVVDSVSVNGQSREIYLNLCGSDDLLHQTKNCSEGALVCIKDQDEYVNLGGTMSEPYFNEETKKVEVVYTNGDTCSRGRRKQTKLTISCSPGQVTKSPVLLHYQDCDTELEWSSALACPTHATVGSDCKVFDANLGLLIDLGPLKTLSAYVMKSQDHSYYINVCGPISISGCPENSGGCQKEDNDKTEKRAWSLGKATTSLTYRDSFVSLVYTDGTPYNDPKRTPRSMTIAFLCDPEAGEGKPVFAGEADRAYAFRWDTKYACPREVSVDCLVIDPSTHRQYDLSSLTKSSGNWEVMDSAGKRKFFLNICRPVNQVPKCKDQSAACMHLIENGNVTEARNLGQALKVPVVSSDGHLQIQYTFGDACTSYGEKTSFSVTINFICHKGSQTEGPRFLDALGACQYTFLWSTQSACSIGNEIEKQCHFNDPISGNVVDLTPLWKNNSYYQVTSQGRTFQFNVCGAVGGGACPQSTSSPESIAACEMNPDGKSVNRVLGLTDSQMLHASANGPFRLTYIGDVKNTNRTVVKDSNFFTHTEIRFECLYSGNKFDFVKQENDTFFVFEFGTPIVCLPDPVDCDVVDAHGMEYDLNPLVNSGTSGWKVEHTMGNTVEQLHISFCKPLTGLGGVNCHGAGICKVSANTQKGFMSLGKQQRPRVASDGTIVIEYKDGTQCPGRTTNYSAQIVLHCSAVQRELKLEAVIMECTYIFSLETPAACPVEVFKGENCKVTDRLYGHTFDLRPLRKSSGNYKVKVGEYTYLLNVCGPLTDAPGACSGSAICQTKESDRNFVVSTGKPSQNLTLRDGLIQLRYQDGKDKCRRDFKRNTILSFVCDHSVGGIEEGPSFVSEENDCTYIFKWTTYYACPPHEVSNCYTDDDKGQLYDLSDLSQHQSNYVVLNPNNRNQKFLLNVCRSLVYQPGQLCDYGTVACLVNESDPNIRTKAQSIGNSLDPPEIVDGKLRLLYSIGELCPADHSSYLQTQITFECDPYAQKGQPEFLDYDSCTYNFLWRSASACAKDLTPRTTGHCTATNPETGYVFNLTSLATKEGHKVESSYYIFLLNICNQLEVSPCKDGAASCLVKHDETENVNLGKANGDLFYSHGSLYLNYTGGDDCNGNDRHSTLIFFECSRVDSGPVLVSHVGDCTFEFNWNTPFACENKQQEEDEEEDENFLTVPCVVHTENGTIDLTPLMQHESAFHSLSINRHIGIYGLSICKSLSSFSGSGLNHPSAICSLCFGQTKPLSLGSVNKPPYLDPRKRLVIDYVNGSACPHNPKKTFSTRVVFVCDYTGEDILEIVGVDETECMVMFELSTPLACVSPQVKSLCNFASDGGGYEMDLAALGNKGQPFRVQEGNETYLLGICQVVNTRGPCSGAGVCVVDKNGKEENLGVVGKTSFFHNGVHLSMIYHTNEECHMSGFDKKQSEIRFYCDPTIGTGNPQLYKRTECLTVFLWPTSAVCHLDHPPCTLFTKNKLFDLRELSSISHSWPIKKDNESYWLNICREVHQGIVSSFHNATCPTYSSVCKVNKENQTTMLGNILTQRLSYNDKSRVLLLTYDHGDTAVCPPVIGKSEPLRASTEISFTCGKNVGSPVFLWGPDDRCVYHFSWNSSVACAETKSTRLEEINGLLVDERLKNSNFMLNISMIQHVTFLVREPFRNDDNYTYAINLKGEVGPVTNSSECANAAVCQYKQNRSFYRDIGTKGTGKYYLKGNGLRLILTSHGRTCGKNKHKNVTSIIMLQCASAQGLGTPEFLYENNNCDYFFQWETIAVCPHNSKGYFGGVHISDKETRIEEHSNLLSVPAIIGICFLILAGVFLVLILARRERRNKLKTKVKSCFRSIRLPCYTYRDFQCYFLKTNGSLSTQSDGEAVLLAPHESFAKFNDDSDTDPIA